MSRRRAAVPQSGLSFRRPVHAARGANVEGAFADLLNGGDARERQEESEVIGEIGIGTGDGLAGVQIFGLEVGAVGGE
jgi:hypothetical protein